MREKGRQFLLEMAVPGADVNDLDIQVTPDDLLVKGDVHHEHREEKGQVYACEFESGSLFRAIRFPRKINPKKVTAECKNGMLHIKAPIALEQRAKKVRMGAK
jgi:HSP20 family protein